MDCNYQQYENNEYLTSHIITDWSPSCDSSCLSRNGRSIIYNIPSFDSLHHIYTLSLNIADYVVCLAIRLHSKILPCYFPAFILVLSSSAFLRCCVCSVCRTHVSFISRRDTVKDRQPSVNLRVIT